MAYGIIQQRLSTDIGHFEAWLLSGKLLLNNAVR